MTVIDLNASHRARFLRYVGVGGANTLISYCVYAAAICFGGSYLIASLLSLAGGVMLGFWGQGRYVFGVLSVEAWIRYLLYWCFAYGLYVLIVLTMSLVGVSVYVGGAFATAVLMVPSYFFQKTVVFVSAR